MLSAWGRWIALTLIGAYKRWLSPHKGFGCAYRLHTGGASCSTLGARAIRRHGVRKGLAVLRERTWLCGVAQRRHRQAERSAAGAQRHPHAVQRGDCDLPCDAPGCDGVGGDGAGDGKGRCRLGPAARALECCDACHCDWPERRQQPRQARSKRQRSEGEQAVHLPQRRGPR